MNMEIARLTNASWLQVPDRRIAAMQAMSLRANDRRGQPSRPLAELKEPVPMLDWPTDLFRDESLGN